MVIDFDRLEKVNRTCRFALDRGEGLTFACCVNLVSVLCTRYEPLVFAQIDYMRQLPHIRHLLVNEIFPEYDIELAGFAPGVLMVKAFKDTPRSTIRFYTHQNEEVTRGSQAPIVHIY